MPEKKRNLPLAIRIVLIVLCVLLAVVVAVLIFGNTLLNRITYVPDGVIIDGPPITVIDEDPEQTFDLVLSEEIVQTVLTPEEQAALDLAEKREGVVNILMIGVDRRGTKGLSRSDTMLIATLDKKNQRLKLCSLMRDMYVPIPGRGEGRINSACAYGGPPLLMQTINENFSLDLTKYVLVDFRMFEKIVDKLGGVTIKMSSGEVAEANDCIAGLNKQRGDELTSGFITIRGGEIKLTGKQALGYSRIRHFGNGDYARTSRQFKVLQAIFSKFLAIDPIKQTSVLYDILPLVETNLDKMEIVDLMMGALTSGTGSLMHYRLPVQDLYKAKTVKGANVLLPDIAANAQKLHEFIYEMTQVDALEGSNTGSGTYHPKTTTLPEDDEIPLDGTPGETVPVPEISAPGAPTPDASASPWPMVTPTPSLDASTPDASTPTPSPA